MQETVFRQNSNNISAFEMAAITNNNVAACFLAEVTPTSLSCVLNISPPS